MTAVGLRELKSNLSKYVRLASQGELVQVTHRGQVVAEIRPPAVDEGEYPLLREALAHGRVRSASPNNQPGVYDLPPLEVSLPPAIVSTLLDELRGDN